MSLFIQRTNPDRVSGGFGGQRFRCAACRSLYTGADEARSCAEADHATGRHRHPAAADPDIDLNCPPCTVAS